MFDILQPLFRCIVDTWKMLNPSVVSHLPIRDTVAGVLYIDSLDSQATLRSRFHYAPDFTDEETKAREGTWLDQNHTASHRLSWDLSWGCLGFNHYSVFLGFEIICPSLTMELGAVYCRHDGLHSHITCLIHRAGVTGEGQECYNDLQGLSLPSSMLLNTACLMSQGLSYVNVGRHSFYL